ncbi:hypothetical protein [Nonomuraea insulae]|uniref:Uncharacterized protein n=1 Tax=Nonomuraea insulae TaxID=1616787 RepID=A0ABW1DCA0_9ACTN
MNHPLIIYVRAQLAVRISNARNAPSRGASAVEWVIITAIVAAVALGLAAAIKTLVGDWQQRIEEMGPKD